MRLASRDSVMTTTHDHPSPRHPRDAVAVHPRSPRRLWQPVQSAFGRDVPIHRVGRMERHPRLRRDRGERHPRSRPGLPSAHGLRPRRLGQLLGACGQRSGHRTLPGIPPAMQSSARRDVCASTVVRGLSAGLLRAEQATPSPGRVHAAAGLLNHASRHGETTSSWRAMVSGCVGGQRLPSRTRALGAALLPSHGPQRSWSCPRSYDRATG